MFSFSAQAKGKSARIFPVNAGEQGSPIYPPTPKDVPRPESPSRQLRLLLALMTVCYLARLSLSWIPQHPRPCAANFRAHLGEYFTADQNTATQGDPSRPDLQPMFVGLMDPYNARIRNGDVYHDVYHTAASPVTASTGTPVRIYGSEMEM